MIRDLDTRFEQSMSLVTCTLDLNSAILATSRFDDIVTFLARVDSPRTTRLLDALIAEQLKFPLEMRVFSRSIVLFDNAEIRDVLVWMVQRLLVYTFENVEDAIVEVLNARLDPARLLFSATRPCILIVSTLLNTWIMANGVDIECDASSVYVLTCLPTVTLLETKLHKVNDCSMTTGSVKIMLSPLFLEI